MKEKSNSYTMAPLLLIINKRANQTCLERGLAPIHAPLLVADICVFSSRSHHMNKLSRLMHLVACLVLYHSLFHDAGTYKTIPISGRE